MDIGNLTYDDEDDLVVNDPQNLNDEPDDSGQHEPDVLEEYLNSQGIADIHKIKFDTEDNEEEERDWNTLTKEEQLNILKSMATPIQEHGLDDDEINLINEIRSKGLTPQQYLDGFRNQQVVVEPSYQVDDFSDDELFVIDLQAKIPNITDEQAQNALAKAKEDEELYKLQIEGLRNQYKQYEDEKNALIAAEQEEQRNQQYQDFSYSILDAISNFQQVGDLEISMDDEDMNQLANFILERDNTGTSYFARALNDPRELVKMAWFALNGEEILNGISDYYKTQISKISKSSYEKGLNDAKKGASVVVKKNVNNNNDGVLSIAQLAY